MANDMHALIVGADTRLRDEYTAAMPARGDSAPVVHYVTDFRRAVEVARSHRPLLAVAEMTPDLTALRSFADELAAASPETRLIGAFRPEIFIHEASESALLIEALRAGVCDFLRRPISAVDLAQMLDRLRQRNVSAPQRLGKQVAFLSNKGGVGKSTLAVNAAVGLARNNPGRVLLVDASLQMGVCAAMLNLQPTLSLTDAAREHARLDEMLLRQLAIPHESGLELLAAPADAVESAEVTDEIVARVLSLARRTYDYVVVDTFPMFDRVVMAVLDQTSEAYIVLENVVPTVLGIDKFLGLLDSIGFAQQKQRLVLNRYSRRHGSLAPRDAEERLQRDVFLVVPYDAQLVHAANLGRPFLAGRHPFSQTARRLWQLVREIESGSFAGAAPVRPAEVAEESPEEELPMAVAE